VAKKIPPLIKRQRALDSTMRKFGGRAEGGGKITGRKFKLGKTDCIQMLRSHLVAMGHKGLPKLPKYSSPAGAEAALSDALKKLGKPEDGNLEDLLDALLPRISPASMLPGDVGIVESEPHAPAWRAGSVVISVGGRKFLGWHPDSPVLAVIDPYSDSPFKGAWRA
jgi:hypothetical protein